VIARRAWWLVVGALLGGGVAWREAPPLPSGGRAAPVLPRERDCPPQEPAPLPGVDEELQQARRRVAALEASLLAVTGAPQPFTDAVSAPFRPAAVQNELASIAAEAGFDTVELDCSEYPCLLLAQMLPGAACRDASALLEEHGYPDMRRCEHGEAETLVRVLADPQLPISEVRMRYRLQELRSPPPGQQIR
jgi:hypothetical protein